MADKKEETKEEGCCSTGRCHCCGGRLALMLVLLLIGGLIGYAIGHCGSGRWMHCPFAGSYATAPQTPAAK